MLSGQTLFIGLGLLLILSKPVSCELQSYVVYMGAQTFESYVSDSSDSSDLSNSMLSKVTDTHYGILAYTLGSPVMADRALIHSYGRVINGFAAVLDEEDAARIAERPEVVSVFPNGEMELLTSHSWEFMGLENKGIVNEGSLWDKASYGEDVIVATLDSGVLPESKSFTDEGYGPVPTKWRGICENDTKEEVPCNKKLIGASYFNKGFMASVELKQRRGTLIFNASAIVNSTRDIDGHGTHTLSTAGGNPVPNASVFGFDAGIAKGGAPRARLVAYRVCWPSVIRVGLTTCVDSDTMQGFVQAVVDGVDVISVSIGAKRGGDYLTSSISIGAFNAMKAGIVVVCSAGNAGPGPGTVLNVAPWVITVGASTTDRVLQTTIELGNGLKFKGRDFSPALPENKQYPLISGANAVQGNASSFHALQCLQNTLDPAKVKGKILVCLRTGGTLFEKEHAAIDAGAAGMILYNTERIGNDREFYQFELPATIISFADGQAILTYVNNTENPVGYISSIITTSVEKPSPMMTDFTARGPNQATPYILKPDITAPGVNIIASFLETTLKYDPGTTDHFKMLAGTSASCPHVAGIVALLKKVHPDWSPAAIKSAIMTTARTTDSTGNKIRDYDMKEATPFSYGAGHIDPNPAMDPGLIYDLTMEDYLNFLCASGVNEVNMKLLAGTPHQCINSFSLLDFNYPSISAPNISGTVTATRKVKNVGSPGTYKATVVQPVGVSVTVEPSELIFDKTGEEKSFKVLFSAKETNSGSNYVFGELTWFDGTHLVKSPIVASVLATS